MAAKIVTANRLIDGTVVYLTAGDGWSEWVEEARVAASDEESAAILALAEWPEQRVRVIGPCLIEVTEVDGKPWPVSIREIIRANGPTVRRDLGKQAVRPVRAEEGDHVQI
jgi:sulfite reductase (NADPH) hemoprotein beta-component